MKIASLIPHRNRKFLYISISCEVGIYGGLKVNMAEIEQVDIKEVYFIHVTLNRLRMA